MVEEALSRPNGAARNTAANRSGSRKHAFMDVLFDNVMLNQ